MAAPLDEGIRKQIFAMFSKGLSTNVIVEKTGASKSTVKRLRSAWKGSRASMCAGAQAMKKQAQSIDPNKVQSVEPIEPLGPMGSDDDPREVMAKLARDSLAFVVQRAKEGYLRASLNDDEHDRAWMETQYLKVLHTSAVQLGKWAGLDDVPPAVTPVSPMERFAEELSRYRDLDGGGV